MNPCISLSGIYGNARVMLPALNWAMRGWRRRSSRPPLKGRFSVLQAGAQPAPEDVARLLERSLLQEIRRRRKAAKRLVFVGTNQKLFSGSAENPHALVDSSIDLEIILQGIPPDVRLALLLRYSRFRWSEIAAALGTTEAAVVSVANERSKESAKSRRERIMNHDCRIVSFISKGRRDFD